MVTVSCLSRSYRIKRNIKKIIPSSYILASSITKCTSAMFVQFVDMGQKAAQSRGHVLYIGLYINTYSI